jgi:RNA polymerase sigma-70 factor, ECF subfamily
MAPAMNRARPSSLLPLPVTDVDERQRSLTDFRRFYVEHVEFVRRVVARLAGPNGDIDDAIQEVFLVALRRRSSFAGRAAPSTWLYAIAQRVVMAARRRARVRGFFGLDLATVLQRTTATPQQIFEHRESSERLYRLLERISDKKRTVFVLFELEGLPGEEIAHIVGCPLKTVWTRLHHARRELQRLAADLDNRSRP